MWREERKLSGIFNWCLALPLEAEADSPAMVGRGGDAWELAGVRWEPRGFSRVAAAFSSYDLPSTDTYLPSKVKQHRALRGVGDGGGTAALPHHLGQ